MTRAGMRRRMRLASKVADKEAAKQAIINRILASKKYGQPTMKAYVLEFILNRQRNGFKEPATLDDIWYDLRRDYLIPNRYPIGKFTRKSLKGYVQELCDLLEIRRDKVGIIAQAY